MAALAAALLGPGLAQTRRDVQVWNTYSYRGGGRYDWRVFIDENRGTMEKIHCVEYTLHPTFPDPVSSVCDPDDGFALRRNGWGEFVISLKIQWKDRRVTRQQYHLDFHSPPAAATRKPKAAASASIRTGNTSRPLGRGQWTWTVFVAADQRTVDQIRCVEYQLHPTFAKPVWRICEPGSRPDQAFPLSAQGWGTFDVGIKLEFRNGDVRFLNHTLRFETTPVAER